MIQHQAAPVVHQRLADRFEQSNLRFGEHSHLTTVKLPVCAQGKISDPELMAMGDQPELPSDSMFDRINA
jgi:hypothetical protein